MIARHEREAAFKQATLHKLTNENAVLKRLKFAAQSERVNPQQRSLLEETLNADLQAVAEEIERLAPADTAKREHHKPKRQPLPANLPRRKVRHEPENTTCACGCLMKRIGEDVAEKLDYEPGVFTVERLVCEKLVQAPVAPHVIDKGIPPVPCSRRCWWPSTPTTCRCIGRKGVLREPRSGSRTSASRLRCVLPPRFLLYRRALSL